MTDLPFSYESIFALKSESDFNEMACRLFQYQIKKNKTYCDFVNQLKINIEKINDYRQIPFLPISFFKSHDLISENKKVETIFYSSGTTGMELSKHLVADLSLYDLSLLKGFENNFGKITDYSIFALLPSYHENKNSSLLYMVSKLMDGSKNKGGFYLNNTTELLHDINEAKKNKKVILIGVSYALLDLAEEHKPDLSNIVVIETGGMKGRRKEMTKSDLHDSLKKSFQSKVIFSEYGMTELLSQAWSNGNGIFSSPPWMKILTRDYTDPFTLIENQTGGINVIDLANVHSCAFIATQDLGIVRPLSPADSSPKTGEQKFEILGRFDNADLRGCNLLVS